MPLHPSSTIREFIPSSSLDSVTDAGDLDLLVGLLERSLSPGGAVTAATALLGAFGGLAGVASADEAALRRSGLPSPAIADLRRVRALAVAMARSEACRRPVLSSWTALQNYLRADLAHRPREQFRTLYLDRRNILIREEWRAYGTVDHAPVYPREVIRRALELSASALILVHNHPSGDTTPSRPDIEMTRKIVEAAGVFGLEVHDHLIVGREGTSSFKSLGLM